MAGKKRRKSTKAFVGRSVTVAGAFATATVGLVGQAGPASAAATTAAYSDPDPKGNITTIAKAINNVLAGAGAAGKTVDGAWSPIAGKLGGGFTSSSGTVDVTYASMLPDVLRSLGQTPTPTGVPGVGPKVEIPG